jgi:putative inorganic carbon (HCO3(-)) transporter
MSATARLNIFSAFRQWLRYNFSTRKFNTVPGKIAMAIIGLVIGASASIDKTILIVEIVALTGIFFVAIVFRYPEVGFYSAIIGSAFIFLPDKLNIQIPVPLGVAIEAIQYTTMLSIIARQYRARVNIGNFWRNPLTLSFVVLLLYYFADKFNPVYHSTLAWSNYVRKYLSHFAFYYTSFVLFNSYERIKRFFSIMILLSVGIAIYGIKQQWFGISDIEVVWFHRHPDAYTLAFQSGFLRKFSILSDPASFGVLCASMMLFTLVLGIRTNNKKRKYWMLFTSFCCLLGASYSGTRTCNLMIVAGIAAYVIFTLNEIRTYRFIIGFVLFSVFMLFGPFKNNLIVQRISSTFQGNKDASAMLRSINRHGIQPYLHSHPMGGGIYTCGFEGAAYNMGHYLSMFQPDSGYMKILAEQGWIGLLLTLIFYFIFMRRGIQGIFESKNPEIKTWYLAITVWLFTLLAGQYSQVAISPYPEVLFYFPSLVILYKLKEHDTSNPGANEEVK